MNKISHKSIFLALSCCGIVFLNSCLSGGILSGEKPNDTSDIVIGDIEGTWVDSFVTIHGNNMPQIWGGEPSETLVVTHVSTLRLNDGEFTLQVMPRVFLDWSGVVPGYDTLFIEREGVFSVVDDTLMLDFVDQYESPPEILQYKLYGDSLEIKFLFSGLEISPGLWELKSSSYIWDGCLGKSEGLFRKLQPVK